MGDDNALLGAGEGYVKLASIFTYKTFVGLIVVVGIASISNIGDDDVVKFKSFCLVDSGDKDALADDGGAAEVGFF